MWVRVSGRLRDHLLPARTYADAARRAALFPAVRPFPSADVLERSGFPAEFVANENPSVCEKSVSVLSSFGLSRESLARITISNSRVLGSRFLGKMEAVFSVVRGFENSSAIMRNVLELSLRLATEPSDVRENIDFLISCGISEFLIPRVLEESPSLVFLDRRLELEPGVAIMRGSGVGEETLVKILMDFPDLFKLGVREIASRMNYLEKIGFRSEEVDRIIGSFPRILELGVENRLKPLVSEFRELDFGFLEVKKAAMNDPRIFGFEIGGELGRCVHLLKNLKCRLPIKDRILKNGLLRATVEVKQRVDCLCRRGLNHRDAFKLLWREPRIILYDLADIEKKIDFLEDELRLPISILIDCPEFLGVNLEKRIVPRFRVIQWLKSQGGLGIEVGLKDLVKPSKQKFYNFFVKPYPECERIFGKSEGEKVDKCKETVELSRLFKPKPYTECENDSKNIRAFMESLF